MNVLRRAEDRPKVLDRIRYSISNGFESKRVIMILWLGLLAVLFIFGVSLFAAVLQARAEEADTGFGGTLWSSFMRTLDPGTMARDVGWKLRVASLLATLGGIGFLSLIIGLITNAIAERTTRLRRGPGRVISTHHTLILGWSSKLFPLVTQLLKVKDLEPTGAIVVLAPLAKDEMERQIEARLPQLTRREKKALLLRTGTTYELEHLGVVRPDVAHAAVALNPGGADGDAEVVRSTLAFIQTTTPPRPAVIVEIHEEFTAQALESGAPDGTKIVTVRAADFVARMMAQVSLQPGLSEVYDDVLQFDGRVIYVTDADGVEDRPFAEALLCYDKATLLGVRTRDEILLCPPMDRSIARGEKLIALAETKASITATTPQPVNVSRRGGMGSPTPRTQILMIGWNQLAPEIIRQLDRYVAPGSTLTIRVDGDVIDGAVPIPTDITTLSCRIVREPLSPETLKELMARELPEHLILLCYKGLLSDAEADARALLTLLHVRKAIDETEADPNIVVELLDERDAALTQPHPRDEFIVSERLAARVLAQYSETPDLAAVFDELLDERDAEIYLKPSYLYAPDEPVPFAAVVAGAAARGEIAIGYQIHEGGTASSVVINPPKSEVVDPERLSVVVLAHEPG